MTKYGPPPPPPVVMDPVISATLEGQVQMFKNGVAKLEAEIKDDKPDETKIQAGVASLRHWKEELDTAQDKALDYLVRNDQAGYNTELQRKFDLRAEMELMEVTVQRVLQKIAADNNVNTDAPGSTSYHRVNLPQRKLQPFNGDVREWLGFWSSFEDIHEDVGLSENDKFLYLLECIPKTSVARKVIDGFTVSAKNYQSCVEALKNMYGRSRMLVKVFVRDLLQLVIENATKGRNMDFLELYPKLSSHIRNLEELKVTSDKCEEILYPLVESCLPEDILLAWQRNTAYEEKLDALIKFLNTEVNNKMDRCLAKMDFNTTAVKTDKHKRAKMETSYDPPAAVAFMNAEKTDKKRFQCAFCNDSRHESHECGKAKVEMSMDQKQAALKEKKCCYRCLRQGHFTAKCKRFVRCCICGGKHYEIMCNGNKKPQEKAKPSFMETQFQQQQMYHATPSQSQQHQLQKPQPNSQPRLWSRRGGSGGKGKESTPQFTNVGGDKHITLSTLLAVLETPTKSWKVRVFLDGGAEVSYIKQEIADEAGLPMVGVKSFRHQRFGGDVTEKKRHRKYEVTLCSLDGKARKLFVVHGIDRIAIHINKPKFGPYAAEMAQRGIVFHDQMEADGDIHVMFGMDILAQVWTGGFHRVSPNLYAAETIFGWVVGGEEPGAERDTITTSNMVTTMMINEQSVENLWALEAMGITEDSTSESKEDLEKAASLFFEETVTRQEDGRYVVHLPWKEGHKKIQSNYHSSLFRLKKTTVDLQKQQYWSHYDQIFRDWENDDIIEEVTDVGEDELQTLYLLPHRHVVKENSSTTPVRPVFDASAKGKGGPSLNDCLAAGPNLLELIPAIMCRFRKQRVGVVSDIKKAFLQIEVARKDQEFLYFLWWTDMTCQKIKLYRHRRVVFGVKPSPFLLAATLSYHVKKECAEDVVFRTALLNSLYVDNSCSSHPSMKEAVKFQERSQQVLLPAKFDLRGWEFSYTSENKEVAVLGMLWNTQDDCIKFSLDSVRKKMNGPSTKRGLLSLVNSLFDPMGYLCAFSIIPKLLLQDCCLLKLGWDDALPEDIADKLKKWKDQVPVIEKISIPRWIGYSTDNCEISVHCFCDASGFAFATKIFLRVAAGDTITVQLIMAKSRVAPVKKKITIPRLELLACGIGARLTANHALKFLEIEGVSTYFWSDSTTALTWIRKDKDWARFVNNRVEAIRKLTKREDWFHVPGELNPADVPSRGCSVESILEKRLWEGPAWLKKPKEFWPNTNPAANEDEVNVEMKKSVAVCSVQIEKDSLLSILEKYSDYHQIIRILALVNRYLKILREKAGEKINKKKTVRNQNEILPVSASEFEEAEKIILRLVQKEAFTGVSDKRIVGMGAFMDDVGLIRVKSQLLFGNEDFNIRCPVVLPYAHPVVKSLIYKEHCLRCHAGVQILQANLREYYWILKSRRAIGAVVTSCPTCKRYNARRCEVPPAPLPYDRIRNTVAFDITGIDLAGPLYLRGGSKAWVVLFTCAVYRAVHLELVTTLSTQGFLDAFRRFVARRGRPTKCYSDNGLNFIGCANLFKEVDWSVVQSYAAVGRMSWVFNPPTAAWWGGFWERLIGIMKQLIRRVLGKKTVDLEEMQTLLCDVECALNQRPLTYVSDRKEELISLCPAHFLKDNPRSNLPEADVVNATNLRSTQKKCQVLREELRMRFRREYLGQLQHQAGLKERTVKIGDVVIIEDDNRKRIDWSLGVIIEVYPGRDGRVRTARVKTKDGVFLRAVQRLFIMEVAEEERKICEDVIPPDVEVAEEKTAKEEEKVSRFGRKLAMPERLGF